MKIKPTRGSDVVMELNLFDSLEMSLELARKIKDKNTEIYELKIVAMSPKSQILSDMPKGGGVQSNPIENYLIRLEKKEAERDRLCLQLSSLWNSIARRLKEAGADDAAIAMLAYRFKDGYLWKKCSVEMKNKYPNGKWNVNKCFRVYRSILHKANSVNL